MKFVRVTLATWGSAAQRAAGQWRVRGGAPEQQAYATVVEVAAQRCVLRAFKVEKRPERTAGENPVSRKLGRARAHVRRDLLEHRHSVAVRPEIILVHRQTGSCDSSSVATNADTAARLMGANGLTVDCACRGALREDRAPSVNRRVHKSA